MLSSLTKAASPRSGHRILAPSRVTDSASEDPLDQVRANREQADSALLRDSQLRLQQLKLQHDPQLDDSHRFRAEDEDFLVRGVGDPAEFFESRFPALTTAFSLPIRGREDMSGTRLLNPRNQIRQTFEYFEPGLRRTDLPNLPGVRLKPVLRVVASLYYAGRMGKDESVTQALRQGGFRGASSAEIVDDVMRELRFSKKERKLAKELLGEVPFTGNGAEVNDFEVVAPKYDISHLDEGQAAKLQHRADELGLSTGTLFQIGTLLHSAYRALTPWDLTRGMRWSSEGWEATAPLAEIGLPSVAALKGKPARPSPPFMEALAEARNDLDQIQDERRMAKAKPARHPLWLDSKLNPEGMVLCHALKGLPKDGKLRPNSAFSEGTSPLERDPRHLVEFSWNGTIDQWNEAPAAVLTPLSNLQPNRLENLWYTATSHLGEFEIPEGSVVVLREDLELPSEEQKLWENRGLKVVRFGVQQTLAQASESALGDLGYQPMTLATDFSGGTGTATTWLDDLSLEDRFDNDNAKSTTKLSQELAQQLGIRSAAGTESYPLGKLTFELEGLHSNFERYGWVSPSYSDIDEVEALRKQLNSNLEAASAGRSGSAWATVKESAMAYSEALGFEVDLVKEFGPDFRRGLRRELASGRGGRYGAALIERLNARYHTDFTPDMLREPSDLPRLRGLAALVNQR